MKSFIKSNSGKIAVSIIVSLLILGTTIAIVFFPSDSSVEANTDSSDMGLDSSSEDWDGEQSVYNGEEEEKETIAIPGFDVMNIEANESTQAVNLYNPESNNCYFKMTITLDDGTQLWQSDLVEPGKGFYEIEFEQTLEVGLYEGCILTYECFSTDGNLSELNGSAITFKINSLA